MNNFIGEFLTLRGAFEAQRPLGRVRDRRHHPRRGLHALALSEGLLRAGNEQSQRDLPDLNAREAWQFAPLIFLIFWIGIYPKPLLDYINPQTERWSRRCSPRLLQDRARRAAPAGSRRENRDAARRSRAGDDARNGSDETRSPGVDDRAHTRVDDASTDTSDTPHQVDFQAIAASQTVQLIMPEVILTAVRLRGARARRDAPARPQARRRVGQPRGRRLSLVSLGMVYFNVVRGGLVARRASST